MRTDGRRRGSASYLVALVAAGALSTRQAVATEYNLIKEHRGPTFYDEWDFYSGPDIFTASNVSYLDRSLAAASSLAYVNDAGNAILKVDNTRWLNYGEPRASVRVRSLTAYPVGSLWVYDALHMPYGCSVWGALWSLGETWPEQGEIDTYEGVNQGSQDRNQIALHTTHGCYATPSGPSANFSGALQLSDCDSRKNNNAGCKVLEARPNSFGPGSVGIGGGLWVTEMAADGIRVWSYSRDSIPSELLLNQNSSFPPRIDTNNWGTPAAHYPASKCKITDFFGPQYLTMNIALCGSWAGDQGVFESTCAGSCPEYVTNPRNYDNAFFELASVRVYSSAQSSGTARPSAAARLALPGFLGVYVLSCSLGFLMFF